MLEINKFYNMDCMVGLDMLDDDSIDMTLTDIPYDGVNDTDKVKVGKGIRTLQKGKADIITFDLQEFLEKVYAKTKGTIIIFCGTNQVSEIYKFFKTKQILGGVLQDN